MDKKAVKNEKKYLQILKIFFKILVKILLEVTKMPPSVSSNDLRPQRAEQSPNAILGLGLWFQRTIIVLANETGKSFFNGSSPFRSVVAAGAGGVTLYHIVRIPHAMFKARAFRYNLTLSYKSHGCLIYVTVHLIYHNSNLNSWSELHDKYKETEKNLATKTEELDQVQNRLEKVSRALESKELTFTKTSERTVEAALKLEILEQAQKEGFSKMLIQQGDQITQQQEIIRSQTQTVKLTQAQVEGLQQIKQRLEGEVDRLSGQVERLSQQLKGLEAIRSGQEGVLDQLVQIVSKIDTPKGKISGNNPDGKGAPTSTTGDTQ